jgi:lysozyme family protein
MRGLYWLPAHCDVLPVKLSIANFDTAYNEGPPEAIMILQHCLGVETDGVWGPITAGALQTALAGDEGGLLEAYLSRRLAVYQIIAANNPDEAQYLDGWDNRVAHLREYLAWIAA